VIHVQKRDYRGWPNTYFISNGTVELAVLADVGPRVIRYGFLGGENQFFELDQEAGLCHGDEFRLYGGHRLWVWPEVARTYYPDNRPVEVKTTPTGAVFTALIETELPGTSLQKSIAIALRERGTHVHLAQSLTNHCNAETRLAPWSPTLMRPGGRGILPFPPRAAMDQHHFQSVSPLTLWSFTDFTDSRWVIGQEFLQLIQQEHPSGRFPEQMTGLFNPAGWGAYIRSGQLFLKRTEVVAGAQYPDFGCNFELFTNSDFLELETLGPLVTLLPGESTRHSEDWYLFDGLSSIESEPSIRSEILPRVQRAS